MVRTRRSLFWRTGSGIRTRSWEAETPEPVLTAWSGRKETSLALAETLGDDRWKVTALLTMRAGQQVLRRARDLVQVLYE